MTSPAKPRTDVTPQQDTFTLQLGKAEPLRLALPEGEIAAYQLAPTLRQLTDAFVAHASE